MKNFNDMNFKEMDIDDLSQEKDFIYMRVKTGKTITVKDLSVLCEIERELTLREC